MPPMDDTRVNQIFTEMGEYVIELANDPSLLGPKYFQDIIAVCRNYLNRVSLVTAELNRERLTVSGKLRECEATYALDYDDLLASDDRVKNLANIEDRKATANYLLKPQRQEINTLKARLHTLESVHKVVSHRSKELNSTMAAIKDQRRLMDTELSTGSFYGDERKTRVPKEPLPDQDGLMTEDFTVEQLNQLLSDSEAKVDEPKVETPKVLSEIQEEPKVETTKVSETSAPESAPEASEEADINRFLGSDTQPMVSPKATAPKETDDLMSFLDGL